MKMYKNLFRSSSLLTFSIGLMFVAVSDVNAANLNTLDAYVFDGSTFDPDVSLSSPTDAVSFESSTGVSTAPPPLLSGYPKAGEVAGYAYFNDLKAQAYSSNNGTVTSTQSSTNVGTTFSGNVTGSTPGTIARFNISLRIDGILNSGAAPGDNTGSVGVDAKLRIRDQNHPTLCGEGCMPLMELGVMADSTSHGSDDTNPQDTTFNSWSWNLQSRDLLGELIDNLSDSDSWVFGPGSTCLSGPCYDISFDTGTLSTTIETTVGATLDFDASLDIFAQGTSFGGDGAYGSADFYDSFGFMITPLTEGVALDFGSITLADVDLGATVPVPPAVWLFGSGLIGLIGIARRKQA